MTVVQLKNKELIERYPFLQPRNIWTDQIPEGFNYNYTRLDEIPDGWKVAFGLRLCEELRAALIEEDYLDKFRFSQIKEKYGRLCLYNFGASEKVHKILHKYEKLSKTTCILCGAPATKISRGWISPYCDDCGIWEEEDYIPIKEYYDELEEG